MVAKENNFSINWNENVNEQIEISPFNWVKVYDGEEYEMEGAYTSFINNSNQD